MLGNTPVIGITARHMARGKEDGITALGNKIHFSVIGHSLALENFDCIPVILPLLKKKDMAKQYLELIDGLLVTEGDDLSPGVYNCEKLPECSDELDPVKDNFEMEIIRLALDKDMPILGICRGVHILNAIYGGTLYQDILKYHKRPENKPEVIHRADGDERYKVYHNITIKKDSIVHSCYHDEFYKVNSIHHQGIDKLGAGLTPTAWSDDGIIEALEIPEKKFVLALQWHPERIWDIDPVQLNVFRKFIDAVVEISK